MEENHQNKTENKASATKDKLWLPPLSPQDQKKLDRLKERKDAQQRLINIAISAACVGVIALVYIGFGLNWPSEVDIPLPYWAWVLIPLILIGIMLLTFLIHKEHKNAQQLLILVVLGAALVGMIVYKGFSFNWSSELWISLPYWVWVLVSLILLIGIVLSILLTRMSDMEQWIGFKGKTLWDWLDLTAKLAVPLILGIATISWGILQANLVQQQHDNDQKIAYQQHLQDQASVLDQQRQATLVKYQDDMRDLLLNRGLLTSKSGDEIRVIALTETLSAMRELDAKRNSFLIQFLRYAHLNGVDYRPSVSYNIVNFLNADLSNIDFSGVALNRANLGGAYMYNANLRGAGLAGANLRGASLGNANLSHADLFKADLRGAYLGVANLSHAILLGTDLRGADLSYADLDGAYLYNANLRGGYPFNADLRGADLSYANLRGAKVTQEQLAQAKSLQGVTMPDGSTHP